MKLNQKNFIIIIASIIFYALFLIFTDLSKLNENVQDFQIKFIPLILFLVTSGWLALYLRWTILLKNSGYDVPHKKNFQIFLAGFPLSITPGKIGELLKSQLLKDNFNIPRKITSPIILVERLYNAVGILIISFFAIWFLDFSGLVILISTCVITGLFLAIRSKKLFLQIIKITSRINFLSKFSDSLSESHDVINMAIKPKIFIISSILSACYWILESIAVYFIFKSFGIDFIDLIQVIPTYATSIILGVASFIPGGIGVVEGTLTGLLNLQGLTLPTAMTLTIFVRLFTIWYSVIVGFFALKLVNAFSYKV